MAFCPDCNKYGIAYANPSVCPRCNPDLYKRPEKKEVKTLDDFYETASPEEVEELEKGFRMADEPDADYLPHEYN